MVSGQVQTENRQVQIKNRSLLSVISIVLGLLVILIFANEILQIVSTHNAAFQGILLLSPVLLAPLGALLAFIAQVKTKDHRAKWGIIINLIALFVPIFYIMIGNLLYS